MKIITTSGHTILADDADEALLASFTWYVVKTGRRLYAQARSGHARIKMHRLLMQPPDRLVVHHRNNDGLDNRRDNLEVTTTRQNLRYSHESEDRHGVHLHKQSGKWRAQPRDDNGRQVSLGLFESKDAAVDAVLAFRGAPSALASLPDNGEG